MTRFTLASVALAALSLSCGKPPLGEPPRAPAGAQPRPAPIATGPTVGFTIDPDLEGLRMHLRSLDDGDGTDGADSSRTGQQSTRLAKTTLLDGKRTAALLSRLGKASPAAEKTDFKLRKGSAPPPRTGKTVDVTLRTPKASTPPGPPGSKAAGALSVVRHAPEGRVKLAPHASLTFSAPMVAVSDHASLAKLPPVATIEPQPPGRFRWLGNRTLLFDPEPRFPMSTRYRVAVEAGTRATDGAQLAKAHRFEFETGRLLLEHHAPRERAPTDLQPVLTLGFDQRIDADALLPFVHLKAKGTRHALRVAEPAEVEADGAARKLAAGRRVHDGTGARPADRTLALIPVEPLPQGTRFTVRVGKGAPSAEGPLTTTREQSFKFATRGALALEHAGCNHRRSRCEQRWPLRLRFNNPLAQELPAELVQVSPSLGKLEVWAQGDTLHVRGEEHGLGSHRITVGAELRDTFGQTLGSPVTATIEIYEQRQPPYPQLSGPPEPVVTLPPGAPSMRVTSGAFRQLELTVHRVGAADFPAFRKLLELRRGKRAQAPLPGKRLLRTKLPVKDTTRTSATTIDLAPHLRKGRGHLLVRVQASARYHGREVAHEILHWVQATDIGLVALSDRTHLLAWATRLSTGAPIEGASMQLPPDAATQRTDAAGLVPLPLKAKPRTHLIARDGDDWALLPRSAYRRGSGWQAQSTVDTQRLFTFNDRGLYKPGETAHVKGWARSLGAGVDGDVAATALKRLDWALIGPRGNSLGKGHVKLGSHGGFAVDVKLPPDMNLGHARLELTAKQLRHGQALEVQEFRRPRFEVEASARIPEAVLGDEAVIDVAARYYAGGALPGADVHYTASASAAVFRPAGLDRFSFGPWRRWWELTPRRGGKRIETQQLSAKTDGRGEHHLGLHLEAMNPPQTMRVDVTAAVADVDHQRSEAKTSVVVHPSQTYVGLATAASFTKQGEPLSVDAIVVDPSGKTLTGIAAQIVLSRVTHARGRSGWEEKLVDPVRCEVVSGPAAVACEFAPAVGGVYVLDASVEDSSGRPNETRLRVWVHGKGPQEVRRPERLELEKVELVPERRRYQPGQTARILVQAPFHPAHGVMTVERSGIVSHRAFTLEGPTAVLEVPVESRHIPNLELAVELVGSVEAAAGRRRVAHASGSLSLEVPPLERTLEVQVTPGRARLQPGEGTTVDVTVRDARGQPVRDASLVLLAIDEAVLTLADYRTPDPLAAFYSARPAGVDKRRQRDGIAARVAPQGALAQALEENGQLADTLSGGAVAEGILAHSAGMGVASAGRASPARLRKRASAPAASAPPGGSGPVRVRSDFAAAALFAPDVRTDAKGHARVKLALPDSLTRYRVTAVAVDRAQQFGSGEASVTAALPLRVLPSPPRFAQFGDRFELPIVVHNAGASAVEVELAVRADNASVGPTLSALKPGAAGKAGAHIGLGFAVPAGDRVAVRIPTATQRAGRMQLQVVAAAENGDADAADISLPVYTPATAEAFATYGELTDDTHRMAVAPPAEVWPQFGGLSVSTSSTQLQALTDALLFVVRYPYGCSEQLASRILSVLSLRDVLRAFEAPDLPSDAQLDAMIDADLETLAERQHPGGGFGFWTRSGRADPYVTVHVASALALAKRSGRRVPGPMLQRIERYLAHVERHIPGHYGQGARIAIESYALHVRHGLGSPDPARAAKLWRNQAKTMSVEAMAWLLPTLHAGGKRAAVGAVLRALQNRVTETASDAHFTTRYEDGEVTLLHSSRRSDAIVLGALLTVQPDSDLIVKLVRGLLGHRVRGRWRSTQENTFVLQALDGYFRKREGITPNFLSRVWLGEDLAGEHRFRGRTTERAAVTVPMDELARRGEQVPLTLGRTGKGRMYYRVGLRYAPRDLTLAASDHGFAVSRSYRGLDDPADVERRPDGSWRIRAGARVEVEIEMAAEAARNHVALVDPLPAGLEPLNPALSSDGALPDPRPSRRSRGRHAVAPYWWWSRTWYEHQNMRDERVEAFTRRLHAGVHTYRYVARATTPGQFIVPPARAEEMYSPETFGRGRTHRVTVE